MGGVAMRRIYLCFPGGRHKAITMSYDDGKIMDRRLVSIFNQYGLKGTFHLNSGLFGETRNHTYPYISKEEVKELYFGHEISCHTCTHATLTRTPAVLVMEEIIENRKDLEFLSGYPVVGMSYPNGCYNENIKQFLKQAGIVYSRTTKETGRFDLPDDFLEWHPTCHHNHHLLELAERFVNLEFSERLCLLYVWGHSYEFERDQNWELMERFGEMAGNRDEIWYATNAEIYEYMQAAKNLVFLADGCYVYNPSAKCVWIQADGVVYEIPSGTTTCIDRKERPSFYLDWNQEILFHPCIPSEGQKHLDPELVTYRKSRREKTVGNPYYVLGEPIGDIRDNMYPQADPLAVHVKRWEKKIQGVQVRIYKGEQAKDNSPCFVFIHGGAFIGGSVEAVEEQCCLIAEQTNGMVVNIDYRLAPEYPYPAGIEDCLTVMEYVYQQPEYMFDRSRFYAGGDSAGANLLLACLQKEQIRKQMAGVVLLYPVTDLSKNRKVWSWKPEMYPNGSCEMEKHCASSLAGCEEQMIKLYLQGKAKITDAAVSPIYMEVPENFPKTLLITAEYDYLRMQGEAFGKKLKNAGVPIQIVRYGGMCHAFFDLLGKIKQAENCVQEIVEFIQE